jgi:membrane associated rhomboid family serine protease
MMIARLKGKPKLLREVKQDLPARLETVLGKAMALDAGDRYHQRLANIVEEMRIATGGPRIECFTVRTLGLNAFAWLTIQKLGSEAGLAHSLCDLGLIPGELLQLAAPGTSVPHTPHFTCVVDANADRITVLTHMFLHGGWFHLLGNMWFLWIFGNNVEDSMGHARFALFYLLCGLAAAGLQVAANPTSPIPMVGAPGAGATTVNPPPRKLRPGTYSCSSLR